MKVKIVIALFVSMLLLMSCGSKEVDEKEMNSVQTEDGLLQEIKEDSLNTSSSIGGGQGTPVEEVSGFRN